MSWRTKSRRRIVSVATALVALAATPVAAGAAVLPADTTAVISGTPDLLGLLATPVGDAFVTRQAVNEDGTRVAFISGADGLVAGDDDDVDNVYVKFVETGAVELVSRADGATGEPSHGDCSQAAISNDGHQVAFTCEGSLDPADTNAFEDVYVRNLDTQHTTLVSRAPGGAVGDEPSVEPAIAVNGATTFVAFTSSATNLLPGEVVNDNRLQVYRRAIASGGDLMGLMSKNGDPGRPDEGEALHPSISNDGLRVAFETLQELDPADTSAVRDVYIRDLRTNPPVSRLVSASQAPGPFGDIAQHPVISGDGTAVAFDVTRFEPTGPTHNVFLRSLVQAAPTLISSVNGIAGNGPSRVTGIDDSGTVVGFESSATNLDAAATANGIQGFAFRNGAVQLVSRSAAAGPSSTGSVDSVAVSGDGTKVVMHVSDPGIVGDVDPRFDSVVLRDLVSGTNQTVSRPPGIAPFANAGGDARGGSVSADGRFVAFASDAAALGAPVDGEGAFVRDVVTGAVTLVSREDGPNGASLNGSASDPQISADGRRVAFVLNVSAGASQVYVRDIPSGRTFLVSSADGPDGVPGDGGSSNPSISDDGSRVAFRSSSANLADGDADAFNDVYVRQIDAGRTALVSRPTGTGGKVADSASSGPAISGDGRSVAFQTDARLVDGDANALGDVYVRDIENDVTRLVSVTGEATQGDGDADSPSISRDGNRISFASDATNFDAPAGRKLFVRDVAAGTLTVAGRADGSDGAIVTDARVGRLSADGRSIAFSARPATSIAPGAPGDGVSRVYERDLASGVTRLISRLSGADGAPASGSAAVGGITADGGCVTFSVNGRLLPPPASAGDVENVFMRTVTANCGRPVPDGGPGPGPDPGPVAKPAVLSRLAVKPARFHVGGRKGGTRVLFRLDKASSVTLAFDRLLPGHRAKARRVKGRTQGGRCSTRVRRGKACTVVKRVGRISLAQKRLRKGANSVTFSGKLGRKALAPGRYRLTATPLRGKGRTVRFVVVKAPKPKPTQRKAPR